MVHKALLQLSEDKTGTIQIYISLFVSIPAAEGGEGKTQKKRNENIKAAQLCAASEEFRLVPEDITPVKKAGCNNTLHPKK